MSPLPSALTIVCLAAVHPFAPASPAQRTSVQGRVIDAASAVPIADARVAIQPADGAGETTGIRSAQTTSDGRFAFGDLPAGRYALSVTTVGYIFVRREVELAPDAIVDLVIPLTQGTGAYREVVDVRARRAGPPELAAASQSVIGSAELQELRGVIADDPMRAVQALPGVVTGDDFRSEFSVRGSAFRHVGVVLDETATGLLTHTVRGEENTGSLAMINSDILSRAVLSVGPHVRRHGDWLGATLEFDVRDGSRARAGLRAAVSGTAASVVAEGPLGSGGRGSWLVSARKSYLDWLIRKVEPGFESTLAFYDGHAKLVWDFGTRQQLQVLVVGGRTDYREQDASPTNGLDTAQAGSALASVGWRYGGDRWVARQRTSIVGSAFTNRGVQGQELASGDSRAVTARADLAVTLGGGWRADGGGLVENLRAGERAREYRATPSGGLRIFAERDLRRDVTLVAGWASVTRQARALELTGGVRVSGRTDVHANAISPWLLARWRRGAVTWTAGAGGAGQFPDPLFVLLPGEAARPERSRGIDLGVEHQISSGVTWRLTAFRRTDRDLLRPAAEDRLVVLGPGTARFSPPEFPMHTAAVDGTTTGVDLVVMSRATSGLTGWVGYTWAHTRMRDTSSDPTVDRAFDGDFDQRHTLNVAMTQRLSYRLLAGAKLRVGSNTPIPGYFEGAWDDLRLAFQRNEVRLPVYARLDLRLTRTFTFSARRLTLFVEALNVLGRDNYGLAEGAIRGSLAAVGYTERLIPFVPSAGFLIEF